MTIQGDDMAVMTQEVGGRAALSGLTRREVDVLCRLAAGLSNAGIARDLWLSERTVEAHVARIFDKLGLNQSGQHRRVAAALAFHDIGRE